MNTDILIKKMQRKCKGCKYYSPSTPSCDYYLMTGQRRGSKDGNDCEVKEVGTRPKPTTSKPLKPVPKDEWLSYMKERKR